MARSIHKHILRIDQLLQGGKSRKAGEIARALGVSPRTVARYVGRLRDEFNAPVLGSRQGYQYGSPFSLEPSRYSERDLFALYAAQSVLQPLKGTFLTRQIHDRIQEMLVSIGERVPREEIDIRGYLSIHLSGTPAHELDSLFDLLECALTRRRIRMRYRSLEARQASSRLVEPYAVSNRNGAWYLVAHDHKRDKMINFNVSRIERFRRAGSFERDPHFDLEAHFRGSFSVMKGERPETVRIRFSGEAARFVREREFHPEQKLRERPDGSVEFEVTVDHAEELVYFAWGYGSKAEILSPGWLREQMAGEIRKLHRLYSSNP